MPNPQDSVEMQTAEVSKKEAGPVEESSDIIIVKVPDQLSADFSQLPYAPAFTNLIRFLNALKDHPDVVKGGEVPLPQGNFLYILPQGEDVRRCVAQIANQFAAKLVELLTPRVLAEDVASAQVIAGALERCLGEPHTWATLLYIPDFGDFIAGLHDPSQNYALTQVLRQNALKDPPIILVAEVHNTRAVPPSVRAQFDFVETVPSLSREEAISVLREVVKCELPWDSPDLLCAPLWLNQLQKVGTRINLMNLAAGSKQRKLTEKDFAKIVREITSMTGAPEDLADKGAGISPNPKESGTVAAYPKNVSFGEQILQDLASRQFALASGVLDKLLQGTPINTLTETERTLLAENSILLSDDPAKLKVKLLNAKKRVEAIQTMFKKG